MREGAADKTATQLVVSPAVSIAQFGHVAIPHLARVTVRGMRGVNGPAARTASVLSTVGATWGPSERRSLKRSEWLQPRKHGSLLKLHCRDSFVCRARFLWREADALREEMGECTGRETAGYGSKRLRKGCRDNVGKGDLPAGSGNNLQRPGGRGRPRGPEEGGLAHEPV
jgi:hypothetical protein